MDIEGSQLSALKGGHNFLSSDQACPMLMEWRIDVSKRFIDTNILLNEISKYYDKIYEVCNYRTKKFSVHSLRLKKFVPSNICHNILLIPKGYDLDVIKKLNVLTTKPFEFDFNNKNKF